MDDLFTAIKLFNGSMQELATTRAVNDAREQVQQINTQVTKEGEKRQAFQALANDLALRLAGAGAPATTIQSAFQAVAPEQFANPEQAQWAGMLNQADSLEQAAEQGIAAGQQRAFKKGSMELGFDVARMREKARLDEQLFGARSEVKNQERQGQPLSPTLVKQITPFDTAKLKLFSIEDTLNRMKGKKELVGPINSRIPARDLFDEDFSVLQREINRFFNDYKKENTGQAAGVAEMKLLRDSIIKGDDPLPILQANLRKMLEVNERSKATVLMGMKRGKHNVSEYLDALDRDLIGNWDPSSGRMTDSTGPQDQAAAGGTTRRAIPKSWVSGD